MTAILFLSAAPTDPAMNLTASKALRVLPGKD